MQFIEKKDNIERVYSVHYDRKKLKNLLNEIVKKSSYKTNGTFTAPYSAEVNIEKKKFVSGASLPNGDCIYENIEKVYRYTSSGEYSYHNDSIAVVGTKVTPPALSYIIKDIQSKDSDSINSFLNYENHQELIPIDERILALSNSIDEISNFETEQKISALNRLKDLCEKKKLNQFFDVELLKKYYIQTCELIELELISEKVLKKSDKILLKDYKTSK